MAKSKRPKGEKYRGLSRRDGGVIYFERKRRGMKRVRISTGTSDWIEAAAFRDVWLERHERRPGVVPTFAEAARDALDRMEEQRTAQADESYAATTALGHRRNLDPKGSLVRHLGPLNLDSIDDTDLRRWYDAEVIALGLAPKTAANRLDSLAMVYRFARDYHGLQHNPIKGFREQLESGRRTKRARASRDRKRRLAKTRRLTPAEFGSLTKAARERVPTIRRDTCCSSGRSPAGSSGDRSRAVALARFRSRAESGVRFTSCGSRGASPRPRCRSCKRTTTTSTSDTYAASASGRGSGIGPSRISAARRPRSSSSGASPNRSCG
jgi:hypothetical protein